MMTQNYGTKSERYYSISFSKLSYDLSGFRSILRFNRTSRKFATTMIPNTTIGAYICDSLACWNKNA